MLFLDCHRGVTWQALLEGMVGWMTREWTHLLKQWDSFSFKVMSWDEVIQYLDLKNNHRGWRSVGDGRVWGWGNGWG